MDWRGSQSDLFEAMLALCEAGRPFAVATVLSAEGSTPLPAGARALIEADGRLHGTVGGGSVEAEAQRQAEWVLRTGKPVLFGTDLGGPSVHEPSPICGGTMRLLVAPSSAASGEEYRRALAALARRERGVWLTCLRQGAGLGVEARFIREPEFAEQKDFPGAHAFASCLAAETPALLSQPAPAGGHRLEPLIPKPVLVIVGGGHVGQAVATQASWLGFEITVIEDRPEFADATRFPPGTTTRCGAVAEELAALPLNRDTFIVLVTRGHQHDSEALRACIRRPAAYIGMIGSRRKVPLVRRQFLENGWATAEEFDRVYAPIGLNIGAVTVTEIAASIVAQMVSVRRKGSATRMPTA